MWNANNIFCKFLSFRLLLRHFGIHGNQENAQCLVTIYYRFSFYSVLVGRQFIFLRFGVFFYFRVISSFFLQFLNSLSWQVELSIILKQCFRFVMHLFTGFIYYIFRQFLCNYLKLFKAFIFFYIHIQAFYHFKQFFIDYIYIFIYRLSLVV